MAACVPLLLLRRLCRFPPATACAGFKTGICAARPLTGPYSLLTLSNNTSVVQTLNGAYERFMSLYKVRAHIHHYTQYMDGEVFRESLTQVMDVISAYNEMESAEDAT